MDNIKNDTGFNNTTTSLIKDLEKELLLKEEKLASKEKEINSKDKEISDLKNELDYLKAQIINKNKKIFGKSSEQLNAKQLSLFNEAEKLANEKLEEPTIEEITYQRTKPSTNKGKKDNLANLEKVVIDHKLELKDQICDQCDGELTEIGKKSKEILKYIPAKLYIEEHVTYSYACKACEETNDKAHIVTTSSPTTLIPKSMASNGLLSHVINLKYQHHLPLYRQENYFKMLGANLSRQTLSNWMIRASEEFEVVYDKMKEVLLSQSYIQADETTLKVIDDKGKDAKAKKYMWLYKSGASKNQVILYDYQRTRSGSCPKAFLKGFTGVLQTDGYTGYNSVQDTKRLYCLAHIRRKFHEIVTTLNEEALKTSRAVIGFNYCEKLYQIEKALRNTYGHEDDYYQKRYQERLEKSAPIIDEFIKYVNAEIVNALPRSPLGKALAYTKKLLPSFKEVFLTDGTLEIDNNGAERSIKPFVLGRKNWLFSTAPKGARASATLFSIIETAKANGLIIENYLVYLMDQLANIDISNKDELLKLMPWSSELPTELKIKVKES